MQLTTIDDPETVKSFIIERNSAHLNKTQCTYLTIKSLASLIGTDSFTTFGQELLEGIFNTSSLTSSLTLQKYLQKLKSNKELIQSPTKIMISLEDLKRIQTVEGKNNNLAFKKRNLGHYYSPLVPDEIHYENEKEILRKSMWNIYHQITSIALRNEKSFNRWLFYIVILLLKFKVNQKCTD